MMILVACLLTLGVGSQESRNAFDHSPFDVLLKRYVDEKGMVDYRAWKARDVAALDAYLESISETDPDDLASREETMAFWINAYNALTIRGIIEFYPVKSIKDKVSRLLGYDIWDDYTIPVGGKERSLNEMEHQILRKMGEPRIHFALVCASIGCPRLRTEAYRGADLERQLEDQARAFLNDPGRTRIDVGKKEAHLSQIFKWFAQDFGGSDEAILEFVARYRPEVKEGAFDVEYLDYDWALNEQTR
jgi:hypothetical protein